MRRSFRNFKCSNQRCAKPFTEFVEQIDGTIKFNGIEIHHSKYPCPFCATKNATMIVPQYHSSVSKGSAKGIDTTLRQVADGHGMTNMSNSGGKAAMPMVAAPSVPDGSYYEPAPGFKVPYTGNAHAGWSSAPPQAKISANTNKSVDKGSGLRSAVVSQ